MLYQRNLSQNIYVRSNNPVPTMQWTIHIQFHSPPAAAAAAAEMIARSMSDSEMALPSPPPPRCVLPPDADTREPFEEYNFLLSDAIDTDFLSLFFFLAN